MTNSVPPSPSENPQNSDPQREFSPRVAEQLGWYVYALRDPRDNRVFYIGKGKGNRVFAHANAVDFASVDDHDTELGPKLELIRTIKNDGFQVGAYILRHGLSNENAAYDVEAGVLDALALLDPVDDDPTNPYFGLKNLVKGLFLIQSACRRSARPPEWMSDRKM